MGLEYALVYVYLNPAQRLVRLATQRCRHIKYTIPPGILLTVFYRPLFTRLDAYKLVFLLTVYFPR